MMKIYAVKSCPHYFMASFSYNDIMVVHLLSRRFSGIPEGIVEDAERRYAASVGTPSPRRSSHNGEGRTGSGSSQALLGAGLGGVARHFAAIPEVNVRVGELPGTSGASPALGSDGRPRILIDRIAALERLVPSHLQRLHATAAGEAGTAHSTRSAPEGERPAPA